jgi:SAM-dependent methyltransferase
LAGERGKVIAVDVQRGMLDLLERKLAGTGLEDRVEARECPEDAIGVEAPIDFALLFYVAHETPDQAKLFAELAAALKPEGRALLVEPGFHVKRREFAETLLAAERAGLRVVRRPFRLFDHAAVLGK